MTIGLFIRDGSNVLREITELTIRDATNMPRDITELWIRDTNNVPRLVFNPGGGATLRVTVTPGIVSGSTVGTGTVTTNAATAVGAGGTAPYTYAWTLLSHSAVTPPTADTPSADDTTFTQTGIMPSTAEDATWKCTVTDDNGNTADSDPITSIFVDLTP
jgi:hypothetical protein